MIPDLKSYDVILVNSSAGKDSQAMLDYVARHAERAGVRHRVVVVHCDLGRVEWKGTKELAALQAKMYDVRFEVIKRNQNDLLEHVEERGKWPSSTARYCTSDHKRAQVDRVLTKLVGEKYRGKQIRILNCLGMRAEESPARSKLTPFEFDKRASNGKRHVDKWLPIHHWTVDEVWTMIRLSGVPHHEAYDHGMPRLSCCFCIFAPEKALLLAGKHNPELLAEYVRIEEKIGHSFKANMKISLIAEKLAAGIEVGPVTDWAM